MKKVFIGFYAIALFFGLFSTVHAENAQAYTIQPGDVLAIAGG